MERLLATFVIGTTLTLAAAAPSFAAVIPVQTAPTGVTYQFPINGYLGSLSGAPKNDSSSFGFGTDGAFNETFNFDVTKASKVSVSYTASYSQSNQIVTDFVVDLYKGYNLSGSKVTTSTGTDTPYTGTNPLLIGSGRVEGALAALISGGSYSINLSGTSLDTPSVSGTLTVSVSTVPLPASAPMFGAALLALGAVGYGAKRKKAVAAV